MRKCRRGEDWRRGKREKLAISRKCDDLKTNKPVPAFGMDRLFISCDCFHDKQGAMPTGRKSQSVV
jgi:hypothetical protein